MSILFDKYSDGTWVVFSRTDMALCPLENLDCYMTGGDAVS